MCMEGTIYTRGTPLNKEMEKDVSKTKGLEGRIGWGELIR